MGVEAARLALARPRGAPRRSCGSPPPRPAYLDKTNATTIHAALRLPPEVAAFDFGGALRSGVGALGSASRRRPGTTLVVLADSRDGLPTSADESAGGTAQRPSSSVTTARGSGHRRVPRARHRSATSSSTAGATPATAGRRCGRSASARPATWRSASRPGRRPQGRGADG